MVLDSPADPAHIQGGKLALAVTTAKRSALPDVPTVAEAGFAGYDIPIWTVDGAQGTHAGAGAGCCAPQWARSRRTGEREKMHKLGLELATPMAPP